MTGIEILKKKLSEDGFVHIYDWVDEPGTKYPAHAHRGKVTFYVTEGSLSMNFEDGTNESLKKGDRFDVPIGLTHTAIIGQEGCTFVVGEEIEGDS